jgi:hypothetical protein
MNPRDADVAGVVRIHRMIRRGTSYGPPLPDGVLEDDGQERGLMFAFVGANLGRQFEFVQSEWMKRRQLLRASKDCPGLLSQGEESIAFCLACAHCNGSGSLSPRRRKGGTVRMPLQETFWAVRFGLP